MLVTLTKDDQPHFLKFHGQVFRIFIEGAPVPFSKSDHANMKKTGENGNFLCRIFGKPFCCVQFRCSARQMPKSAHLNLKLCANTPDDKAVRPPPRYSFSKVPQDSSKNVLVSNSDFDSRRMGSIFDIPPPVSSFSAPVRPRT